MDHENKEVQKVSQEQIDELTQELQELQENVVNKREETKLITNEILYLGTQITNYKKQLDEKKAQREEKQLEEKNMMEGEEYAEQLKNNEDTILILKELKNKLDGISKSLEEPPPILKESIPDHVGSIRFPCVTMIFYELINKISSTKYQTFRVFENTTFENLFTEALNLWDINDKRAEYKLKIQNEDGTLIDIIRFDEYIESFYKKLNAQIKGIKFILTSEDVKNINDLKADEEEREKIEVAVGNDSHANDNYKYFIKRFAGMSTYINDQFESIKAASVKQDEDMLEIQKMSMGSNTIRLIVRISDYVLFIIFAIFSIISIYSIKTPGKQFIDTKVFNLRISSKTIEEGGSIKKDIFTKFKEYCSNTTNLRENSVIKLFTTLRITFFEKDLDTDSKYGSKDYNSNYKKFIDNILDDNTCKSDDFSSDIFYNESYKNTKKALVFFDEEKYGSKKYFLEAGKLFNDDDFLKKILCNKTDDYNNVLDDFGYLYVTNPDGGNYLDPNNNGSLSCNLLIDYLQTGPFKYMKSFGIDDIDHFKRSGNLGNYRDDNDKQGNVFIDVNMISQDMFQLILDLLDSKDDDNKTYLENFKTEKDQYIHLFSFAGLKAVYVDGTIIDYMTKNVYYSSMLYENKDGSDDQFKMKEFPLSLKLRKNGKHIKAIDVFRIIFIIFIFLFSFYNLYDEKKKNELYKQMKKPAKSTLELYLSMDALSSVYIFVLMCIDFHYKYKYLFPDINEMLGGDFTGEYCSINNKEFYNIHYYYEKVVMFESLIIIGITIRVIFYILTISFMSNINSYMREALHRSIIYLGLYFLITVLYTIYTQLLWGNSFELCKKFSRSYFLVLIRSLKHFTPDYVVTPSIKAVFEELYYCILVVVIIFFIMDGSISTFIDSYRINAAKNGNGKVTSFSNFFIPPKINQTDNEGEKKFEKINEMENSEEKEEEEDQTFHDTYKLKNELKIKETIIREITIKNNALVKENENLKLKIEKLQRELSATSVVDHKLNIATNDLNKKTEESEKLNNELTDLKNEFYHYKSAEVKSYNHQINKLQMLLETNNLKLENAGKIEKFNDTLYAHINELEEVLAKINEEQKEKIEKLELDYQRRLGNLKKRMIDYLKDEHSNFQKNMNKQSELNSKLTLLHVTELTRELEFQISYIEDLLNEKEILKRKVNELTHDLHIHQEVSSLLVEKNNRIKGKLLQISQPLLEEDSQIDYKNYNKKIKFPNNPKILPKFNINSWQTKDEPVVIDSKNSLTKISKNLTSESLNKNNTNITKNSTCNVSKSINFISAYKSKNNSASKEFLLTKELISKEKEKESYKSRYDTARAKIDFLEKKYYHIFQLFDNALEKIYNENKSSFSDPKLFMDLEKFKSGVEFENLLPNEQYSLIVLIMKIILPLVNEDLINIDNMHQKFSKVKPKFSFNTYFKRNSNIKSLFSSDKNFDINIYNTQTNNFNTITNFNLSDNNSNLSTKKSVNTENNNNNRLINFKLINLSDLSNNVKRKIYLRKDINSKSGNYNIKNK